MSGGTSLKDARTAKKKAAQVFHNLIGEVAVGIMPLGRYGLKVNLTEAPVDGITLPNKIGNVPVRIEVVGKILKRPTARSGRVGGG